jgi:hypothetical protein
MSIEHSATSLRLRSKERCDSRVEKLIKSAPSNGASHKARLESINISLLTE